MATSALISSLLINLFKSLSHSKMVVSSAKILTLPEGQHIGKSLINNRKSSGPRTESWGTSQNRGLVIDKVHFLLCHSAQVCPESLRQINEYLA